MTTQHYESDGWMPSKMESGEAVAQLKADLEQALALLDKHEYIWHEIANDAICYECEGRSERGHHPDCIWANLLSKYNREVRFHDDLKEAE